VLAHSISHYCSYLKALSSL